MIIAIDGPAASGKGTLGKKLAAHYGFRHLDTGLLYRAVASSLLKAGASLTDEAKAIAAAQALDPESLGDVALKSDKVGEAASVDFRHSGGARRTVRFSAQFCLPPSGSRSGRARHRHGDLP